MPRCKSIPKQLKPLKKSWEGRVSYRREAWSLTTKTKQHCFRRRAALLRFLRRLHANGRPELSGFAFVVVEERVVLAAPWTEIRGVGGAK